MPRELVSPQHSSLRRFAVLTAIATLGLVGIGGLVTSHGAGMAVPDWPNTYGYNTTASFTTCACRGDPLGCLA
jgi:cytochrome c oxidase assembly protein subunit 15